MTVKVSPEALVLLSELSERERVVFRRLARGDTITNIARDLRLSHASVSTYRRRVLEKLGLRTNLGIALAAHAVGLPVTTK